MSRARDTYDAIAAAVSSNRRLAVFAAACAVFFIASAAFVVSGERELAKKRAAFASFEAMKKRYLDSISSAGPLREKLSFAEAASAMDAVQSAASSSGIEKKIRQLKPFEPVAVKGWAQSGAQVRLESINIGRVVQFLHRLENSPGALVVDEFTMKASFEDPDLLEVTATVRAVVKE